MIDESPRDNLDRLKELLGSLSDEDNNKRFMLLVLSLSGRPIVVSDETHVLMATKQLLEMFQLEHDDFIGKPAAEVIGIIHPDDQATAISHFQKGEELAYKVRGVRGNGDVFLISVERHVFHANSHLLNIVIVEEINGHSQE